MKMKCIFTTFLYLLSATPASALAQAPAQAAGRVESNVVYGMYSGLALLLDVHYPPQPNGYGIICVNGIGFHATLRYGASPMKELPGGAALHQAPVGRGLHRVCDQPPGGAALSLPGGGRRRTAGSSVRAPSRPAVWDQA